MLTRKRWLLYHGWTWIVSILLAVLLYVSGDWGVSFDSILEDFCWHRNFGRPNATRTPNSNEYLTGDGILGGNLVYGLFLFYNLAALLVSMQHDTWAQTTKTATAAAAGNTVILKSVYMLKVHHGYCLNFGRGACHIRIVHGNTNHRPSINHRPSQAHDKNAFRPWIEIKRIPSSERCV